MISFKPEKKNDYKFIIISLTAALVLGAFSLLTDTNNVLPYDLNDEYVPEYSKLVLSEIVSSNPGVYVNSMDEVTDYIEIFNGTEKEINLLGYGLSDREDKIKWSFPEVYIEPKDYLLVSLAGHEDGELCAPFKLSSAGGERIIFTNPKAKIIDGVDTVSLKNHEAMVRDENGNWKTTDVLTPGYENSLKGFEEYQKNIVSLNNEELIINEFLTANNGNYLSDDNSDGYIELLNNSDSLVDLSEYYLSNESDRPFIYRLNGTLNPDEILLIPLDENIFNLRNSNGELLLSRKGKVVSDVKYENLNKGTAYVYEDGTYYRSSIISPGYQNTSEGIDAFQKEKMKGDNGLIINEVMNHNSSYLVQNGGKYYDWIELYNNSDETISLSDYALSTDNKEKGIELPDIELGPYEYFVFMCSGDSNLTNASYYHLPIKFGNSEGIFLYKNNKLIDSVYISDIPSGYSYGRYKDEGFYYLDYPSPNAENSVEGYRKITDKPVVSISGGIYEETVEVSLMGRGEIFYTTDGTNPDYTSTLYEGEKIVLDETATLKAIAYYGEERHSDLCINSYIINENHTLPVLSLSLNARDFSNLNAAAFAVGNEKQCYMELFEDGERIESKCSLSLFGGNARSQAKKAYCVRFDSEWGASELDYRLFKDRDNSVYDAFVLRAGSTDWTEAIIRDIVGTSLVDDYTDLDVQAYKPVILYINGDYWGLYNMREKVNPHFIEEHHNVSKDSISIFRIDGEVECGTKSRYDELRAFCRSHDLSVDENYQYVCDRFNVVSLADYWISEGFFMNNDIVNCRMFSSDEYDDGKFHYIFYDLDFAWFNYSLNWYTLYICNPAGMTDHQFENDIILNMMKNKDFQNLWLERLSYLLNSAFSLDTINNRIDEIVEMYDPEIGRDRTRWNQSETVWRSEVEKLRVYAERRIPAYLSQTQSYFHLTNEQMKDIFGDIYN